MIYHIAAMLAGCGGSEPGTGPGGGETAGEFLAGLPSWDEYAPPGVVPRGKTWKAELEELGALDPPDAQ